MAFEHKHLVYIMTGSWGPILAKGQVLWLNFCGVGGVHIMWLNAPIKDQDMTLPANMSNTHLLRGKLKGHFSRRATKF